MEKENKQFLDQLKEFNEKNFSKNIFIPSLQREIKFSTLTAKHQKDIIHSTLDNPILNLIFHDKIYEIIKDLCQEKEFIDTFTIYDKDAIIIQMRYNFISKEYEGKDFSKNIEFIKSMNLDLKPKQDDIDGLILQYQIPSIKRERKILKDFSKKHDVSVSGKNDETLRKIISYAYILELIKHVSKVQMKENGVVVDFNMHSFDENAEIVDYFGKNVCNKIHDFINNNKNSVSDMYKIDKETEMKIDATIFH